MDREPPDGAREAAEEAVRLDPESTSVLTTEARTAAVLGEPNMLSPWLSEAHKRVPLDWRLWEGLGLAAVARLDWSEAEDWFRKRLAVDRQRCCSAVWLGLTLVERGATEEARSWLDHALKANPMCPDIRKLQGALNEPREVSDRSEASSPRSR